MPTAFQRIDADLSSFGIQKICTQIFLRSAHQTLTIRLNFALQFLNQNDYKNVFFFEIQIKSNLQLRQFSLQCRHAEQVKIAILNQLQSIIDRM